jgi:DNA-binding response OmpR family regulator
MPDAKLLVVDDDYDLTLAIAKKLTNEGYEVSTATTGDEAWRVFQDEKPDLTVLDLGLPDMDGLALCRRLKSAAPHALILVLTGRSEEAQQIAGLETGADDYVVKPVSLRLLVTRVRTLLRRRPAAGPGPGEPLQVGMVAPAAAGGPLWVQSMEEAGAVETAHLAVPSGELYLAGPGELWRIDQRWHLVNSAQAPANDLQLRRISMGIVEAGYIVEILADANWVGSVKEVYLYNARTVEEVRDPAARGYLLTDLYKRATKVQGVE